ncbi:MAG: tetratricopeptide repeat protein [Arenicellales bacterium]
MQPIKTCTLSALAFVLGSASALAGPVDNGIYALQKRWAEITYQVKSKDRQETEYKALEADASRLAAANPDRAEPKIWEGIILSTDAGVSGGLSALGKVKTARKLFEQAIAIDDTALAGSAHTSLGSLYYQVPGWPLSFKDDKKAEQQLTRALQINPRGIDPNYFYADYLYRQGRYAEAAKALEKALKAPPRPGRPVADAGRRRQVQALMEKVKEKLGS